MLERLFNCLNSELKCCRRTPVTASWRLRSAIMIKWENTPQKTCQTIKPNTNLPICLFSWTKLRCDCIKHWNNSQIIKTWSMSAANYSLFCITENTFYKAKSYVLISIMIRKYPFHCNGFINFIVSLWNIFLYTKNQVLFILTEGREKKSSVIL